MTKLIVFLGNPGSEYQKTKHNIAWMCLEKLSFFSTLNFKSKFKSHYATKSFNGDQFIFMMPQTFMNLSGESVVAAKQFFKFEMDDILCVHDELDIPYGQIMYKSGGGLGGHNGLKSLTQKLGGQDFKRLRMGISKPAHGNVSSYVLSPFSQDQEMFLQDYLTGAAQSIETYIKEGFERASNKFSKKNFVPSLSS